MLAIRQAIIVVAVLVLAVISMLFFQAALRLYQQLPTLQNAGAWVIYYFGKYSFYAAITTSVTWLLIALFDRDYIRRQPK